MLLYKHHKHPWKYLNCGMKRFGHRTRKQWYCVFKEAFAKFIVWVEWVPFSVCKVKNTKNKTKMYTILGSFHRRQFFFQTYLHYTKIITMCNKKGCSFNILPCNFLRWNRGLPKKLFLMFVSRVFHSWLLALLQVDAVIAGDGVFPAFAPPWCGEFGAGPRGRRRKIMLSILVEEAKNIKLLTIAILWFLEQTNSYCWTWVGSMMGTRLLLIVIFVWLIGWL